MCPSHELLGAGTDPDVTAPDHEHPSHLLVQYRATDARGRRFSNTYSLAGAATAMDAATLACARR